MPTARRDAGLSSETLESAKVSSTTPRATRRAAGPRAPARSSSSAIEKARSNGSSPPRWSAESGNRRRTVCSAGRPRRSTHNPAVALGASSCHANVAERAPAGDCHTRLTAVPGEYRSSSQSAAKSARSRSARARNAIRRPPMGPAPSGGALQPNTASQVSPGPRAGKATWFEGSPETVMPSHRHALLAIQVAPSLQPRQSAPGDDASSPTFVTRARTSCSRPATGQY
jgi:hypothetical protein